MDWTGGVRRRFAPGKNNAVIQKQKAHFAKARLALQYPPSSIPSWATDSRGKGTAPGIHGRKHLNAPSRGMGRSRQSGEPQPPTKSPSQWEEGSRNRRNEKRARSGRSHDVIEISSASVPSTSSSDAAHDPHMADERSQSRQQPIGVEAMDEEQRLLIANRRRLLARSDWLGLSAARPVHMKFRSDRDKDRIGRRRKVAHSTSHKGHAATRRLLTPLFEERLMPREHMMSGALQTEDIQVRIGTDALASQTQRSHHSQTPRPTTARRPSTDLGPLSEEPMLLGDVGDEFEASHTTYPHYDDEHELAGLMSTSAAHQVNTWATGPLVGEHGSLQCSPQMQTMPEEAEMGQHDHAHSDDKRSHSPSSAGAISEYADGPYGNDNNFSTATPDVGPQNDTPSDRGRDSGDRTGIAVPETSDEVDDEAFWRRMMRFEQHTPSNPSLDAVKSSSMHATASESSARFALPMALELPHDLQTVASTPKGAGTQASFLHDLVSIVPEDNSDRSPLSPSASLKQIRNLVEQPAAVKPQQNEDNDDEAAWRDFIIGSQSDSEPSLRYEDTKRPPSRGISDVQPDAEMEMFDVSGLGSSVESTAGGTQHAPYDLSQYEPTRKRGKQDRRISDMSKHARQSQRSSPPAEARTNLDEDDIDDSYPAPSTSKPIVPARSTILNPKRFKPATKRPENVSPSTPDASRMRKAGQRNKTKAKTRVHSIYDLVDSDGESIG